MATQTATSDEGTTDSKDKLPPPPNKKAAAPSKADPKKTQRTQAQQKQMNAAATKAQINRQRSCVPQRNGEMQEPEEFNEENNKMLVHLQALSPFNGRWHVKRVINAGTFGVVLEVEDDKTKQPGVIKVAKAAKDTYVNVQAEWESFVLMKIYKANPEASVCRLLDVGVLQGYDKEPLEYMCLEYVGIPLNKHIEEYTGKELQFRCCEISLMSLKGVYDIHREGLLHRDLKPDNMGIISREQPVILIFDLGLSRMYTNHEGKCREYRSTVGFRGTMEWASGNAMKGREQTRYDDLIAWFYVMIGLFHGNNKSNQMFPWSCRAKFGKESQHFRSMFSEARFLLRHCPKSFFAINTYLQTAHRNAAPDYTFIADRIKDAMEEIRPGSTEDMTTLKRPLPPPKPMITPSQEVIAAEKKN